jgi:hypothetical protein
MHRIGLIPVLNNFYWEKKERNHKVKVCFGKTMKTGQCEEETVWTVIPHYIDGQRRPKKGDLRAEIE